MFLKLRRALLVYIRENLGIYTVVVSFFLVGIIAGALLLRFLGEGQLTELKSTLAFFFESLKSENLTALHPVELLRASFRKNLLFLLIIWLLGLAWFGFPFTLFFLMCKGFALGFTAAFLVRLVALKGVIFCVAALLPHNLILMPAYIAAVTTATAFSLLKLNDRLLKKQIDRKPYYRQYCYFMFMILLVILAGGLVEAYITPVFMQLSVSII
ncbi:MAG: stage II sporulation protein M [Dethiobacteria bacterium]|jgi:stage II sporulation protein M